MAGSFLIIFLTYVNYVTCDVSEDRTTVDLFKEDLLIGEKLTSVWRT